MGFANRMLDTTAHMASASELAGKGKLEMKRTEATIRPGNVIEHKSRLWVAVKTSHVKPGKGGAFAQIDCVISVMAPS